MSLNQALLGEVTCESNGLTVVQGGKLSGAPVPSGAWCSHSIGSTRHSYCWSLQSRTLAVLGWGGGGRDADCSWFYRELKGMCVKNTGYSELYPLTLGKVGFNHVGPPFLDLSSDE